VIAPAALRRRGTPIIDGLAGLAIYFWDQDGNL